MEQSGPRTQAPSGLIFEDPLAQPPVQRALWGFATGIFWVVWVYLWLPLITFVAWLLGYNRFLDVMFDQGGFLSVLQRGLYYLLVVLACGGTLIVWARYNLMRFRGRERRTPPTAATQAEQLAAHLGVTREHIEHVRTAKVVYVWFKDGINVAGLESVDGHSEPSDPELARQLNARGLAWAGPREAAIPRA